MSEDGASSESFAGGIQKKEPLLDSMVRAAARTGSTLEGMSLQVIGGYVCDSLQLHQDGTMDDNVLVGRLAAASYRAGGTDKIIEMAENDDEIILPKNWPEIKRNLIENYAQLASTISLNDRTP